MARADRERLAAHLGLDHDEFCRRYAVSQGGKLLLTVGEDGFCVFFREGCGVHPARPDICRAWPFFKGNLIDKSSWEMIQEYCPGVNPEAGFSCFVRQGLGYIEARGLAADKDGDGPEALKIDVQDMRE